MNKIIPIRSGCIITNQTITHSTLDEMLYCSLIWGLTSSIWKWKKVSSWDTRKVKVSKDIKTNKILDSDEKEKWDLTISWITNAREFCSSRPFTPCILSMAAYSSDLKLQWLPQVHKGSKAEPKNVTWEVLSRPVIISAAQLDQEIHSPAYSKHLRA